MEFKNNIGPKLLELESYYPETRNIFRALNECDPENVKVIILGQDPYHDGSALGLSFDNIREQKRLSPSLRNILTEMMNDVGSCNFTSNLKSDTILDNLPRQGILMLNTALTVEPHKANSHTELWANFTKTLIESLNKKDNIVWIMWGNHAKSFKQYITNKTHHFIESAHPSPLSASRGFFGSKPFSKTNEILTNLNLSPINW